MIYNIIHYITENVVHC